MKYLLSVLLFFFLPVICFSQSVSITPVSAHSENNQNSFPLRNGSVSASGDNVRIQGTSSTADFGNVVAWTFSPRNLKVGLLGGGQDLSLTQLDDKGEALIEKELEFFDPADETLELYAFDDGRSVVRDNVANFSFLDATGDVQFSISNSSQSPEGERESQLAADPKGRTIVLYNPVISHGSQTGSQARLVYGPEEHEVFYRDDTREITDAIVSNNGTVVALLTSSGSDDTVLIYDRFGNELNRINADAGQKGVALSDRGGFITIYSGGRVQVYNALTGERVGSSSTRSSVIYATYIPEDETIIILGGSEADNGISEPTITAVHVSLRQIAREDIGLSLAVTDLDDLYLQRTAANQFRLSGLNQHLDIQTSF